jgi:hypothetical protein
MAKWSHDTAVGPQVARRNVGDLLTLAADKGYDKNTSSSGVITNLMTGKISV